MTASTLTPAQIDALVGAADSAYRIWSRTSRADRAAGIRAAADALDAAADELVPIAQRETHLTQARLRSELTRTTFQLRLFTQVLTDGGFLDVRIDHADPDWGMGPRPDLRRTRQGIGPVIVYAASNFPFAFSVAGGDSASALAAGASVIVKAHDGHVELSRRVAAIVSEALTASGAPAGLFSLIEGREPGLQVLRDPRIKAGSFTGSIPGGRALFDVAVSRPDPIPFFGELGSVNPTFVTRAASTARAAEIVDGFRGSFTLGSGQFCTKPGVLLVPEDSAIIDKLRGEPLPDPQRMLNERIHAGYTAALNEVAAHAAVTVLAQGSDPLADPPSPTLLLTTVDDLLASMDELFRECFGPTALVVTYAHERDLLRVAAAIDGQLSATLVAEEDDAIVPALVDELREKTGRILWNQWSTGVSVTFAQQHGGPWPSTTASSATSVGTAAIDRFLRPVAFQGFPQSLVPDELRDASTSGIPRRIDGKLT